MGTSRVLAFCLIRAAVSMPLIPGITMSSSTTANSSAMQRLQRLLAGLDGHQDLVQRGQDGVQRDQVLGPVVHQKDPGLP